MGEAGIEDLFIFRDGDYAFTVIEDERGGEYWAYGHMDPDRFVGEMSRYIEYVTGQPSRNTVTGLAAVGVRVEHLWARQKDEEHFEVVEPTCTEADAAVFPVSRLVF